MTPVEILKGTYRWNDTLTRIPTDDPWGLDFTSTIVDGSTTTTFTFDRLQNSGDYIQFYVKSVNDSTEDARVGTFINVYNLSTNIWEWDLQDFTVIYPITYDETFGNWFNSNVTAISVSPEPEEPDTPETPEDPEIPDTPDNPDEPDTPETSPTWSSIKAKIQSLTAKANSTTGKTDTDLTNAVKSLVAGYGQGGGSSGGSSGGSYECNKNHIIEVDALPTENANSLDVYKMGVNYYRYSYLFKDIIIVQDGAPVSFVKQYEGMEVTVALYYVDNYEYVEDPKPYIDQATMTISLYYDGSRKDGFMYNEGEWMGLSGEGSINCGEITDPSEATATEEGSYYVLLEPYWRLIGGVEYDGEAVIE